MAVKSKHNFITFVHFHNNHLWFSITMKRRDMVFIQKSIDSTLFDSSKFAGRQTVSLRRFVMQGLAGLHSFSDSVAHCLHHWQDCQSYLSQLCLDIRLVVPSVATFPCCPRQMVPVQPLLLIKLSAVSLDGCLFQPFPTSLGRRGPYSHSVC